MSAEETYKLIKNYFNNKPVKKVQVFGSFARNESNEDSDVDLLLTLQRPVGLITLAGYQLELQDILKKKVDIATEGGLSYEFYNMIKQDLRLVYEKD